MNLSQVGKKGFAHLLVIVLTSRASAFIAQWVMGIFLFPEDFGLIAIISIVYLLASGFKEVGLYQILQEHRDDFESQAPSLTASAQILNLSGVALLLVAAPIMAEHYHDPRLLWITVVLALTMPFNIAALPYKARSAIAFNFKRISRVESVSALASNLSMAGLAAAGAGIYSFVASQVILALVTFLMYRWGQPRIASPLWPGASRLRAFFKRCKWLIVSSYLNNVATRGEYLVLSLILSKAALGLFYFSYQLMAAAVQLIGMALNHLLLPLFSAIRNDAARVRSGLHKAGHALSLMSGALCLSLLVWFPFVIRHVWSGKWDAAISLTLIVTAAVPPRLLSSPLGSSALEAMARYRERGILSLVDALTLIVFVWIGGQFFGVEGACVAMAAQRLSAGMLFYFAAASACGLRTRMAFYQLMMNQAPYLACVAALSGYVFLIIGYNGFIHLGFVHTLAIYAALMVAYVAMNHKRIAEYVLER